MKNGSVGVSIDGLLTKKASQEGSWMKIKDFDGNELATKDKYDRVVYAEILVLGPDSDAAVKFADEEEKLALQMLQDMQANRFGKASALPPFESNKDKNLRRAVAMTKAFRGITFEGRPFEYSEPNARWLYQEAPYIMNQVLSFYQDRINFTKPGSSNSSGQPETASALTSQEEKTE